jgi:D-alanyl-D-alanine dipeptidase
VIHTDIIPIDILRKVVVVDNGERMVDLRTECPGVHFEIAEYLKEKKDIANAYFVRKTVAEMIQKAQTDLPVGLSLLVRCGYRTPTVQQRQFDKDYHDLMAEQPEWTKDQLDVEIEKRTSSFDIAPHCTGGAIDLSLVDKYGKQLDMGTRMGEFVQKSYTHSKDISHIARENRQILLDAMTSSGFINFPGEWWHFSYGAREWAAYANNSESFYGPIEKLRIYPENACVVSCLMDPCEEPT